MSEGVELDAARAEVRLLREILASQTRENDLLRKLLSDASRRPAGTPVPRIEIGSRERMAMLEHTVDVLDSCVQGLAQWDCYNDADVGEECTCSVCRATHALESVRNWRYGGSAETPARWFEGAMHYRTTNGWNPREAKIHRAWVKHMDTWKADRTLGMILTDRSPGQPEGVLDWPTPRDWYVATSVTQWLVTNVGSSILEAAGWEYTQYDEDRVALDAKRAELEAS